MAKKFLIIITLVITFSFCFPMISYSTTTDWKITKQYCKTHYKGYKIERVSLYSKKLTNRVGKKVVYVEKVISISNGKGGGIIHGKWYIAYNKKVRKEKAVVSYCVYNPKTNYCDDVVAVIDNKKIR